MCSNQQGQSERVDELPVGKLVRVGPAEDVDHVLEVLLVVQLGDSPDVGQCDDREPGGVEERGFTDRGVIGWKNRGKGRGCCEEAHALNVYGAPSGDLRGQEQQTFPGRVDFAADVLESFI